MPLGWNERHDGNSEWPQFDKNCIGLRGMCLLTFPDHEILYYPSKINFSHIHKIYSKEMHSWASKSRGFILRFSLFCFHLAMKLVKLDWEGFFLSREYRLMIKAGRNERLVGTLGKLDIVSWEPEGCRIENQNDPIAVQSQWCFKAPFWFSMEHLWTVIAPFWLSTDDIRVKEVFIHMYESCMDSVS